MKTAPTGIRLDDDEHSALGKAAKEDDRTKAAMGRKFIVDGLRKAGWLKATSQNGRRRGNARKKEPMPEQLRHIAPIKLKAVTPGPIGKDLPKFEMVDPTSLLVEPNYQRDTSNSSLKLIGRMVANWDWARMKPPICVPCDKGGDGKGVLSKCSGGTGGQVFR